MLAHVLLEELARAAAAGPEARLDRLLERPEGKVVQLVRGEVEADVREELDRGIEERRSLDALGLPGSELEDEPPAEAVPDPGGLRHAGRLDRLDDVREVRRDRPRRLPAGAAVAAQVDGDDARARKR